MDDGKYLFISDVKERKIIARNSRYKKNGCKSKKCTLPSDYMTRKEIAAMNSECITCDFNKFYTWSEFQKFKDSTKIDYIESLASKYNCSLDAIGTIVFELSTGALSNYISKNQLSVKIYPIRGRAASAGKYKLMNAVSEQRGQGGSNVSKEPKKSISPISMNIAFESFDDNIWNWLKEIYCNDKVGISIYVQKEIT